MIDELVGLSAIRSALFDRVGRDFESTTVSTPLRLAPNWQPKSFVRSELVLVFEIHADANLQTGSLVPLQRVRIVVDVGAELSAIVLILP
ncbi:hypothetical protein C487_00350 [Natrinema pallidum DSM 3751]|uniref:Uncharacterized protein n=1 Tax=Natrinema pallidum DSM 3751 TaxID=1227495 RepID=L9ZB71_9EURY|nr:hypothetical protein C487_00350 [Natrinema pallidum DSM 3751]